MELKKDMHGRWGEIVKGSPVYEFRFYRVDGAVLNAGVFNPVNGFYAPASCAGIPINYVDEFSFPLNNEPSTIVATNTGAKRGTDMGSLPLHMLPIDALHAWAAAFAEGTAKYGENNWLLGFKVSGLIDHALEHLFKHTAGDRSEDHLGHALWNIGTAIYMTKHRPELDDILTKEKIDGIESDGKQRMQKAGVVASGGGGVKPPVLDTGTQSIR